jgi:hypothetical protein
MELVNTTKMVAGYTVAVEPTGQEVLVVVVKGTFHLPDEARPVALADSQQPLFVSDVFAGEPGVSAPLAEADFALRKLRCDVLLNGHAYAPKGRPVASLIVGLRVANMTKTFAVLGDREWRCSAGSVTAGRPRAFVQMPIGYDRAFGGVDNRSENPSQHAAFEANPVGRGFHRHLRPEWIDDAPLPNTEIVDDPVTRPDGTTYRPMSFGAVGRSWQPRRAFAGTYDRAWLEHTFPFLPSDFSDEYYQAAPRDQQIAFPQGGEEVRLMNLSPAGDLEFRLPSFDASIEYYSRAGGREQRPLTLDTIRFEPDPGWFTLVWRAARPLIRGVREVAQAVVGKRPQVWWIDHEPVPLPVTPDAGPFADPGA